MMNRKSMWLLVLILLLIGCGSGEVYIGTVTKLEHIPPTWGIGAGTNRSTRPGGPMVVPIQYPDQYIVTIEVCDLEEAYSVGSAVYASIVIGDTVECTCPCSIALCDFGEE